MAEFGNDDMPVKRSRASASLTTKNTKYTKDRALLADHHQFVSLSEADTGREIIDSADFRVLRVFRRLIQLRLLQVRERFRFCAKFTLHSLPPLRRTIYKKLALSAPLGITGALSLKLLPRLHSRLVL